MNTMYRVYIASLLIASQAFPNDILYEKKAANVQEKSDDSVEFTSPFLALVDGTNLIDIKALRKFAQDILALVNGAPLKFIDHLQKEYTLILPEPIEQYANTTGKIGIIWFNNNYRTLKWLRAYEKQTPHDAHLKEALHTACQYFVIFSEQYIAEVEAAKGIMIEIIKEWCNLRKRPQSALLEWANVNGNERDALFKNMTNIEIFDNFTGDLLLFLKDLIRNCPKSYEKYQEEMKQHAHGANRTN